jgi:hypothetical protein
MNGDGPLLSLDPSADRVSYPPVFHAVSLDPNQKLSNAQWRFDEARRIAANIAKLPMLMPVSNRVNSSRAPDDDPTLIERLI